MLERMQGSRINDQRCQMPTYVQVTIATLSLSHSVSIATKCTLFTLAAPLLYPWQHASCRHGYCYF